MSSLNLEKPVVMRILLSLLLVGLLYGCGNEAAPVTPTYQAAGGAATPELSFAVHPLHNPQKLLEVYGPLVDYLNAHLEGARLRLEASRDYADFEDKLYRRSFAFALPNPFQSIKALDHGYGIIGMAGDAKDFRGLFIVRRDSGINSPAQLRGKKVSFPAPTALAAAMLPQHFLHRHGLAYGKDYEVHYVGSQESSIVNVQLGYTAAGATWPPPWRAWSKENPEKAAQLKAIWETESLPNNSIVVRDDVSPEIAHRVRDLLLGLHEHDEGRALLAHMETARIHPADVDSYQPVRVFLARFAADVRPPDSQ